MSYDEGGARQPHPGCNRHRSTAWHYWGATCRSKQMKLLCSSWAAGPYDEDEKLPKGPATGTSAAPRPRCSVACMISVAMRPHCWAYHVAVDHVAALMHRPATCHTMMMMMST